MSTKAVPRRKVRTSLNNWDSSECRTVIHIPVLSQEILEGLGCKPGGNIVDATIDGGGHAELILERTQPDGEVLGIDRDRDMLRLSQERLRQYRLEKRLFLAHANFDHLSEIVRHHDFGPVHGVLFDLGMSSYHLSESGRGFSFTADEPLDMRFDPTEKRGDEMDSTLFGGGYRRGFEEGGLHLGSSYATAADIVNHAPRDELTAILRLFGEERYATRITDALVTRRKRSPLRTSRELASTIEDVIPRRGKIHPATRTFQALRIAVNQELASLDRALPQAYAILRPQGRVAVISFHSLEDRIVKWHFRTWSRRRWAREIFTSPRRPSLGEIRQNPRARGARLRVVEKSEQS
ncbi:MAG: 16S rRNA (cytosine(1402)-N(4))-methyltransferase [Parcubacteria group bacterium]|nr:16S rRNA (cytosine(1402)-N(4))-methyltransferase [Parcubacteria group bacterium]